MFKTVLTLDVVYLKITDAHVNSTIKEKIFVLSSRSLFAEYNYPSKIISFQSDMCRNDSTFTRGLYHITFNGHK
jgi:hypothetical protein